MFELKKADNEKWKLEKALSKDKQIIQKPKQENDSDENKEDWKLELEWELREREEELKENFKERFWLELLWENPWLYWTDLLSKKNRRQTNTIYKANTEILKPDDEENDSKVIIKKKRLDKASMQKIEKERHNLLKWTHEYNEVFGFSQ